MSNDQHVPNPQPCKCTACELKRWQVVQMMQWIRIDNCEDGSAVVHYRITSRGQPATVVGNSIAAAIDEIRRHPA